MRPAAPRLKKMAANLTPGARSRRKAHNNTSAKKRISERIGFEALVAKIKREYAHPDAVQKATIKATMKDKLVTKAQAIDIIAKGAAAKVAREKKR